MPAVILACLLLLVASTVQDLQVLGSTPVSRQTRKGNDAEVEDMTQRATRSESTDSSRGANYAAAAPRAASAENLNVAVESIDLKNPKTNRKNAGFTDEEREKMRTILSNGFIDTFRYLYPDQTGIYSWWSYRFQCEKE